MALVRGRAGEAAQPVWQQQLLPLVIGGSSSLSAEQLPHQAAAALRQAERGLGGPLTALPGILGCYMPGAMTPVDCCLVPAVLHKHCCCVLKPLSLLRLLPGLSSGIWGGAGGGLRGW